MGGVNDFLKEYNSSGISRFHMPGHKGKAPFLNLNLKDDITEIGGADFLYKSRGIISSLESKIGDLYNALSAISCGGCTLCIQTAICAVPDNFNIIAQRESHLSFYNACALLRRNPILVSHDKFKGDEFYCEIENALKTNGQSGVFVTSPNYYGELLNIKKLSTICKKYDSLLIVDNAHGSHLKFLKEDIHPLTLGADLSCDSLFKTLPVLTGGAVLHIKPGLFNKDFIKYKMSLFGSTSPSYLILNSIDSAFDWLAENGYKKFSELKNQTDAIKSIKSVRFLNTEPSKITIDCLKSGLDGRSLYNILKQNKIEAEFFDLRYLVLMASPFNSDLDFVRLKTALNNIKINNKKQYTVPEIHLPRRKLPITDAYFSPSVAVDVDCAKGKTAARPLFTFPPGTPFILPGEEFDDYSVLLAKKNRNFKVYVLE